MIQGIRHWGDQLPLPDNGKKQQASAYTRSFQADLLASMASTAPQSGQALDSAPKMDGNAVPGLMQVNVDGIEKVWAEQLRNGAQYLNFNQANDKSSTLSGGLGGMLDLSSQIYMLRAKKNLQHLRQNVGLNDLIGQNAAGPTAGDGLSQSLAAIRQQLQNLAKQYDLTPAQLGQKLDLQG
ncbi:MAG: hypothetical protein OEW58_04155 [Gammaproteobacteria bacterium]|nr:hypothetical protein [Gammaproteobacteria bacterium]